MIPTHSETPVPSRSAGVSIFILLLTVIAFTAGCSPAESVRSGAPHYAGTFEAGCSPVDAPAMLFDLYRLGDPNPPQVSITVWELEFPVAGSRVGLGRRAGYGAAFIGGTEWIPAIDGEIGFENYTEGENAGGWFWLQLDGVDRIEGRFDVAWDDSGLAICG